MMTVPFCELANRPFYVENTIELHKKIENIIEKKKKKKKKKKKLKK